MTSRTRCRADADATLATLAGTLWDVREALEGVLFRLVQQRLVLDTPSRRWLARTDDDLFAAIVALDTAEADRAEAAAAVGYALAVSPAGTLAQLAAAAPDTWATVLAEHRLALRVLVRDVDEQVRAVGARLRVSARAVRETLDDLRGSLSDPPADPLAAFRGSERTLLVTAADTAHRGAMDTVARARRAELARFVG